MKKWKQIDDINFSIVKEYCELIGDFCTAKDIHEGITYIVETLNHGTLEQLETLKENALEDLKSYEDCEEVQEFIELVEEFKNERV